MFNRPFRWSVVAALAVCAVSLAGCSNYEPSTSTNCASNLVGSSGTTPVAGTLRVEGTFPLSVTALVRYTVAGTEHEVTGVVTGPYTVATFSGLPSGSNTFNIYARCDAGLQFLGARPAIFL